MNNKRKPRVRFSTCADDHKSPQLVRRGSYFSGCRVEATVVGLGVCFLVVCLFAITFFLSQSDVTVQGTSWLWGQKGRECKRDKDCTTRLRKDFDSLSWGQCLLPPNGTAVCVDYKCVDPAPRPVVLAVPCDDEKWCTVNDKCVPGQGHCAGVTRGCHDVDFCTLETCSEHLGCVSMDAEVSTVCENSCVSDEDCRSEYYCANSRCANFKTSNESLFFSAYEIVPCEDYPDGYSMLQHYIVYENGYSLNLHENHENAGVRYRALRSPDGVFLPEPPTSDGFAVPLVSVAGVQTRVVPPGSGTPAYSEITLTTRTACQSLPDESTCLTKWMNRRYDFELDLEDCVIDPEDPLGPTRGTTLGECLPVKIRRAYSMNLDLIDCPVFSHRTLIPPLSRLRMQSPGKKEETDVVLAGDWVQAVVEMDAEQQRTFPILAKQSPFLTSAVVCVVDPSHRLAGCATGEQTDNCPVRGCLGWSGIFNDNSPLTLLREYMADSERLSAAVQDGVEFCRGLGYMDEGCVPGVCSWGANAYQPPFGSADGFQFRAEGLAGQTIVVDAEFRMQYCGEGSNATSGGRRLSSFSYRSSAVFKLHGPTQVSDLEPSKV